MKEKYITLVKLLKKIDDSKALTSSMEEEVEQLEEEIINSDSNNGAFPLLVTDHAIAQTLERLEALMRRSPRARRDIGERDFENSLLLHSNLRHFILIMVVRATEDNSVRPRKSRGGGKGTEYVYTVNLHKWKTRDKSLNMSIIVENNTVKTCYFNDV